MYQLYSGVDFVLTFETSDLLFNSTNFQFLQSSAAGIDYKQGHFYKVMIFISY